ncbi:MAG TPA: PAS domain S-box protein [Methanospirillum sp.]|uniref:PAS domain S-box protein n=1 Tax=Methanospirillum sp. TaxID=45200 RepID=UPI002C186962|nr:PAS domain S-box protein [Methanospirillum sp.]HWQ63336.1 PAS domain S-box protein [Methanospirillum sp.]
MEFDSAVRVLFVDDEPALLHAIRDYLTIIHSLEVDITNDPADAIQSGQLFSYDCLVVDYDMPDMDGITLLKAIRQVDPDIPVIVFTGKSREEVVIEAINNGADFYLQKGGNAEELFAELAHDIGKAARRFRAERALTESEQLYRAVVEDQTEFICQMDPEGAIRFVNSSFAKYISREPENLIGSDFFSLFGEGGENLKEAPDICDPDNPVVHAEIRNIRSDGSKSDLHWTLRLLFDSSFEPREILAVGRDISAQKEVARQTSIQRDLALELAMVSSVDMVLELSLKAVVKLTGMDTGSVYLRDRVTGTVVKSLDCGPHRRSLCQFMDIWQNDNVDLLAVLAGTSRYYSQTDLSRFEAPFLSMVIVPVQRYDEVTGWFVVGSDTMNEVPGTYRSSLETVVSQIGNVIARIQAEDALRDALIESEERYMQLSESSPDAIAILSSHNRPVYLNPAALFLFGVHSFDEFMTRPLNEYFDSASYPAVSDMLSLSFSLRRPNSCEALMWSRLGREIYAELIAVPITQSGDTAVLLIIRNRTEQKLSERALAESERHFRELADLLPEPVFETDACGHVTFCNQGAHSLLAPGNDTTLIGVSFLQFFSDGDQGKLGTVLDEVKADPAVRNGDFTVRAKDGGERSVLLSLSPVFRDTVYDGVRGVIVDITEMKQYQETLQRTIEEKDVLFRELHHRVKNNMQVISSLLQLQEEYIEDERLISAIHDCEQRIASMALVHETLYRSDSLSGISFATYLENLAEEVISSIATVRDIRAEIDVGDIRFNLDTVVTLGLIINELMVNSMKYAFTGKGKGIISVCMKHGEGSYVISYADDGVGLPPDFSIDSSSSLGMRLVRVLTRQLLGSVTVGDSEDGPGARFTIQFPVRE